MSPEDFVPCDVQNHGKPHSARWSICNLEGNEMRPVVRWFACGRHLHSVLAEGYWEVDAVQVYDLANLSER